MALRCPSTFRLALSLKSRQTHHTLQALLLFTFLKCYDVKIVMLDLLADTSAKKSVYYTSINCESRN